MLSTAAELAKAFADRAEEHDRAGVFPAANYDDLREAGFIGLTVPTSHGGLGADFKTYTQVVRVLAAADASTVNALNMHWTVMRFLDALADERQQREVFGAAVEEGALVGSLTSEPGFTLRVGLAIATKVRKTPEGFIVSGHKHFCSLSTVARWYFTWAQDDEISGNDGLRNLLMPTDAPGIEVHDDWDTLGMRANASNSVTFHDVPVPLSNQIGEPGELLFSGLLDLFTPGYAAIYLGIADAAYDIAIETAKTTTWAPNPEPLATYPEVQRRVADMSISIAAAAAVLEKCAEAADSQTPEQRLIVMQQSKWLAAEAARTVTTNALDVCGGRAIANRHPLGRLLRDGLVGHVMQPAGDRNRSLIGRVELGLEPYVRYEGT